MGYEMLLKSRRLWWVLVVAAFAAVMAGSALAQTNEMAAAEDVDKQVTAVAGEKMAWRDVVENGGFIMYVLGGVSVLTLAFVIYFSVVLRNGQVVPRPLFRELVEKVGSGMLDDARRACEYRPCPLSHVAMTALEHLRSVPEVDPVMLKDIVEGEGSRQAETIQGQTQYLLDIAVVSPMIGLLGTVFGMLKAFSAVALDIAQAKPVVLAAGVSQALITTAFGLIVGIPAMVAYSFFRRRAAKVVSHLESASLEILTVLLSKRGQ